MTKTNENPKWSRNRFIRYGMLACMFLFVSLSIFVQFFLRRRRQYVWVDQPGTKIPIPEEVRGQFGFKAAVSKDGQILAAAGNPEFPMVLLQEPKKNSNEFLFMMALRAEIFFAHSPFSEFKSIWKNKNTSFVTAMTLTDKQPYRLAAVVREYPIELPDSIEDSLRLHGNAKNLNKEGKEFVQTLKNVHKKGFEENVYVFDLEKGASKKLANLENSLKAPPPFCGLVNTRTIAWDAVGKLLVTHNYKHIFTIDQSGQKKDIFALKKSRVFSSLYIDSENNVTFLCGDDDTNYVPPKKWWVFYNGPASLVTIDMAGNVIRKESTFFPGTSCMEENLLPYIQEDKYALAYFRAEKSRDFFLHVVPSKPNVPQTKPEKFGTPYLLHDPNDVNFYYAIYGYLQETGEYLIAKKRVMTFIGTPYTIDNMGAPWVELRRFAPKDPTKFAKGDFCFDAK